MLTQTTLLEQGKPCAYSTQSDGDLWRLTRKAGDARPGAYEIDQGQRIAGLAADIVALLERCDWADLA